MRHIFWKYFKNAHNFPIFEMSIVSIDKLSILDDLSNLQLIVREKMQFNNYSVNYTDFMIILQSPGIIVIGTMFYNGTQVQLSKMKRYGKNMNYKTQEVSKNQ